MQGAYSFTPFALTTLCASSGPRANSTLIAGSSSNSTRWGENECKHGSIAISMTSVRDPRSTFGQHPWGGALARLRLNYAAAFGLSVSDDTVYRALRELGFSNVSARPKAYK